MFHDVLLVVHDVLQCLTFVSWCFTMFNNVLWCLASRTTNAVAASALAGQLRRNRRQLRRNRRWRRRNRRYRRKRDPMLNSVLNGDWSNSVPGRKIPEGTYPNWSEHSLTIWHFIHDPSFKIRELINDHLIRQMVIDHNKPSQQCDIGIQLFGTQ